MQNQALPSHRRVSSPAAAFNVPTIHGRQRHGHHTQTRMQSTSSDLPRLTIDVNDLNINSDPEDFEEMLRKMESGPPEYLEDDADFDAAVDARAALEEAKLRDIPGLPLTAHADAAHTLDKDGVVRLDRALSVETATELRSHILATLSNLLNAESSAVHSKISLPAHDDNTDTDGIVDRSGQSSGIIERSGAASDHFSTVLTPHDPQSLVERRWDLRLRLTPLVRKALRELFLGPVGEALEQSFGSDAQLYELAALVSAPGAAPQPLHADTLWSNDRCLFTTAIALQTVRRDMGPIRILRGTHTESAHDAFDFDEDGSFIDSLPDEGVKACGLIDTGDSITYDGRLLHAGSANVCEEVDSDTHDFNCDTRVHFYVSFRVAGGDTDSYAHDVAYSLLDKYRGRFTLGQLRELSQRNTVGQAS